MRSREAALPLQLAHRAMRPRPLVMLPCLRVLPMMMVVLLVRVSMLRLWLLVTLLVTLTLLLLLLLLPQSGQGLLPQAQQRTRKHNTRL